MSKELEQCLRSQEDGNLTGGSGVGGDDDGVGKKKMLGKVFIKLGDFESHGLTFPYLIPQA